MYVFPGKTLNVKVMFKMGDDPVSPNLAAFVVNDADGEIVPSTNIVVQPDETEAWLTIPDSVHVLNAGEKYRQHRLDVTFTVAGMVFEQQYAYYVLPDLFISHTGDEVRQILGASAQEIPDSSIDFYRAYIDLSSGKYGDDFVAAINSDDMDLVFAAKQLIFWHTLMGLLPAMRMRTFKSQESETSKIVRMGTVSSLQPVEDLISSKYDEYLALIYTSGTLVSAPIFIVSGGVDPVTGV